MSDWNAPDILETCLEALRIEHPLEAHTFLAENLPETPAWQLELEATHPAGGEDDEPPPRQTWGHHPDPVTWTVRYEVDGLHATLHATRPVPRVRLAWELLHTHLQRRQRADTLALTDPLTRLPNRLAWDAALERAEDKTGGGARLTIGMLDLDGFKQLNDTHGHVHADTILQATARILRENLRATDTPSRIGGDEFAFLLTGVAPGQPVAQAIAARLLDALRVADISASIGLGPTLAEADAAMYLAKQRGGDQVTCQPVG